MKKLIFLVILGSLFLITKAQTVKQQLMSPGAWFLFSSRLDQQEGNNILTQVQFFKKDDVSSLLFDDKNRLYSVFSDSGTDMNEDLWKLLDDSSFVITDLNGTTNQVMEIVELSSKRLILRYCDDSHENVSKCITATYFPTKTGWLPDRDIDELNSAGIIER